MNKVSKALLFFMLISLSPLLAQQLPQGISYQAVACDANGVELANQAIYIRASILKDGPNGQLLYSEIHDNALKTDAFGLFTITIGQGTQQSGGAVATFSDIDWSYGKLWLKMEMNPTGSPSGSFSFIGANQIWTVPFAFYTKRADSAKTADLATNATNAATAQTALDDLDKDPKNELQDLKWDAATNTLTLVPLGSGGNPTPINIDASSTNELQTIAYDPATNQISLSPAAPGQPVVKIDDGDKSATNELQSLTYDAATGAIGLSPAGSGPTINLNDNDKDPNNEIQELKWDPISKSLSIVKQGQGGSSNVPLPIADDSPTNELQTLVFNPITNTLSLSPAAGGQPGVTIDGSLTNELQSLQYNPTTGDISLYPAGSGPAINLNDLDKDPKNEIQTLIFDPVNHTLQLSPASQNNPIPISFSDGDADPTNEIQSLTYDPVTNKIGISGNPTGGITLNDNDKDPTNEIQSLSFDPTTNKISISGNPTGGITLDDADKDPKNELQTLQFDPVNHTLSLFPPNTSGGSNPAPISFTDADSDPKNELQYLTFDAINHEISIYPPPVGAPAKIGISDGDSSPTNELQSLTYDSTSRTLSIWPAPPNGNGTIKINTAAPGANEFPLGCGKTDYMVLLSNTYTVPPGKVLFLTAAGQNVKLQTSFGLFDHAISPSMPVFSSGVTISECKCTAYLSSVCPDFSPILLDFNDPSMAAGYTVPAGKNLVVKSGLPIDFGKLEVSLDNGFNWTILNLALSPYEAASRAPTFPAGVRFRPPYGVKLALTGYLFNN